MKTNSNMNLEDCLVAVSDISNSIYNLKKNNQISEDDYNKMRIDIKCLYRAITHTILYSEKEVIK